MGLLEGFSLLVNSCSEYFSFVGGLFLALPKAVYIFFVCAIVISLVVFFIKRLSGMGD